MSEKYPVEDSAKYPAEDGTKYRAEADNSAKRPAETASAAKPARQKAKMNPLFYVGLIMFLISLMLVERSDAALLSLVGGVALMLLSKPKKN